MKAIHWILLGVAIAGCGLAGALLLLVLGTAKSLDASRNLKDFGSPAEARAFASAHLPSPLPSDAVMETLVYERWTDWHLSARVRFASPEGVDRYLDHVRRDRKLNDAYCGEEDPPNGARYFLAEVSACGSVRRDSPQILEVRCYTR